MDISVSTTDNYPYWHPFADMGSVVKRQFVISRADGVWVWDDHDRRYLDGCAALWYSNLGHGRPEIADAVAAQLRELDAYGTFGDYANRPALELAQRVSELAPERGSKVFFGSGGGDAIDTAAKIARAYHAQNGFPERMHLVSRTNGYHGTHGFGTGISGMPVNTAGFGAVLPDASVVAYDDPEALEAEIHRAGPERVAAFFCEPVIGAGGLYPPPDGYIERVAQICREHGVLFVADCVIAGFGRLGTWLGIDRWPVKPDLITVAKGITGGTLPLGAVIVAPHVAEPFFGRQHTPVFRHGATYAGHPTCCAAANAALDIYESENLIERGRTLEQPLLEALAPLADSPLVAEVRGGVGFLAGAELAPDVLEADPTAALAWQLAVREQGVLVRALGRALAVSPPLIATEAEIECIGDAMLASLTALDTHLATVHAA